MLSHRVFLHCGFMLTARTKQQLIEQVAGDTGQPKADVERLYEAIFQRMSGALAAGEKLKCAGSESSKRRRRKRALGGIQRPAKASRFQQAEKLLLERAKN
jgi:nucleoid DNA-binding protein